MRSIAAQWARFGLLSECLGKGLRPKSPPILVMSLPRSGSSWVGAVLGHNRYALYLREPLTQSRIRAGSNSVVFPVERSQSPPVYERAATHAFSGIPMFPPSIVPFSKQWRLWRRWRRRVVVKEVNPLALDWLIEQYHPRVIFLVRHPAAVALSYRQLGWTEGALNLPLVEDNLPCDAREAGFWTRHGVFQGAVLQNALQALDGYGDAKIYRYEDICRNPIDSFRDMYDFADLPWNKSIRQYIVETTSEHTTASDSNNPYRVHRDTHAIAEAWRKKIEKRHVHKLREAFHRFSLSCYSAGEW